MSLLSIVVPCFNEEENIETFYNAIINTLKSDNQLNSLQYELIFIDDGSSDLTLTEIKNISHIDSNIKFISLSRNFGKEAALYAGLKNSTGDYVLVMDVDLQDPPFLIKDMFNYIITENYDCVATRRVDRKGEPKIRSFFARKFYKIINKLSDIEIIDGARDFRLMKREMVNGILEIKEHNRFSKGIFAWVGFKTKWLEFENIQRAKGETSWSFFKLFKYSLEGITAFSSYPLYLSVIVGMLFSIIAFILIIVIVIRAILFGDQAAGWPSMMCIILLLGGIQLFSIGIVGQYLGKTYIETKNRPIYIEKESNIIK